MKRVVIFGAGGHAHVIADIIRAEGNEVVAFLDDDLTQEDCSGPISDYSKYQNCEYIIGVGNADVREKLSKIDLKWHTAIHPSAIISPSVTIGEGTCIMPLAVINTRSRIGSHCIINTGAIVEHDNTIGDYSHISVGTKLGGTVSVGKKCWIGIGASIINNSSICSNTVIGAGSTVIKSIGISGVYVGTPCIRIK